MSETKNNRGPACYQRDGQRNVIDLEPQRIKRFQETWNRDQILMRRLRGEKQW